MCVMSMHVEARFFKVWHDDNANAIHSAECKYSDQSGNQNIIGRIQAKVAHFEDKLPKLRDITTILELALWKKGMNEYNYQRK